MSAYPDRSFELLKQTIDALPVLVAYLDSDFQYQFMNAAYQEWVGEFTAECIRKGDLAKAVGENSAEALWKHRQEACRTKKSTRFEITFTNTRGEIRNLEVQYIPHLNSSGEVDGLMVLGFDLTDLRKTNASLRSTEYKLQSVLNDRRTGYWDIDFSTDRMSISDHLRERLGLLPNEEVSSKHLLEMVHPEDRQLIRESTDKVLKEGVSNELEYRMLGRDQAERWVFVTTHPIFDDARVLKGLMGIAIDITEKKQMERMIEAQKVQMLASSRMSAIGEMASGVAHEINNPGTISLGNVELLKSHIARGTLNLKTVEHVCDKIDSTVMRISKIIHSLRSLSRDGEKDPLEPVPASKIIDLQTAFRQPEHRLAHPR